MDIEIRHLSNTFNYGSMMMGMVLIQKLKEEFKDAKIYVDLDKISGQENMERLKKGTKINEIYYFNDLYKNRVCRIVKGLRNTIITNKKSIVIILGGDDISEYYGVESLIYNLKYIKKQSRYNHVFLIGQTLGPFSIENIDMVKESLRNIPIYTRDSLSTRYLKSIGIENLVEGRDLAFNELPKINITNEIKILNKEKYITIVPSGLSMVYTKDYQIYLRENIKIIKELLKKEELKEYKIVLLAHVLRPHSVDDRKVIKDMAKELKEDNERIIVFDKKILPQEARYILKNSLFTITGRMHAAISTFYEKKPAISLSYSIKYEGVIGEGLDLKELIVESNNSALWENGTISKEVLEKVDYALKNYDEIIKNINEKIDEIEKINKNQINTLINKIIELKG